MTQQPGARSAAAVRALGLSKIYGQGDTRVVALDRIDCDIAQGRFTAIMGPSGSGKSTLMHCLAGLDAVTFGQVWLGDLDLATLNDAQLTRVRRQAVGFVFQSFNLIPTLTALENITLPLDIAGRPVDEQWLSTIVSTLGLRERLHHRPAELSGGQQQRVACARALASRPRVIFADEPTGNLDSRSGAGILRFLRRSVDEFGQTVVMVTHDPLAAGYSHRVLFLVDGHIVDDMEDPTSDTVVQRMIGFESTPRDFAG